MVIFLTMSTDKPAVPVPVLLGHIFLITTGVMYSAYWIIRYYDTAHSLASLLPFLVLGSILIGFSGIFLFFISAGILLESTRVKSWPINVTGVALFIISLVVMGPVFQRPFTSEIFFAFLWALSEMNLIHVVYKSGRIAKAPFYAITTLVFISTAVNLVCYRIHLELAGFDQFINGLIPYCVNALFMIIIVIIMVSKKN